MEELKSIGQRPRRNVYSLIVLAFATCLFAVGCSTGSTSIEATPATGEVDSTSPLEPVADDVTPNSDSSALINPSPGGDDFVVCSGTQLPMRALQTLEPMSSHPEIETAVNSFLESGEGEFWPQDGWQMVTISDVELADGTWRWAGSVSGEDCVLESVVPEGLNRVEWELDPDSPAPTEDSTSLNLLATERECASGQPMGDRLLPPTVLETDAAVLVAMVATPAPGDSFDCPGNPQQSITVDLSAPLGDRDLVDGSTTAGRLSEYVGETFGLPPVDG